MVRLDASLTELRQFVANYISGVIKQEAVVAMQDAITRTLSTKIFVQSIDDIYEISSSGEMRRLIRSGGTPKKGRYSWDYARKKIVEGTPPHVKTGRMKNSLINRIIGDSVYLEIPDFVTTVHYTTKAGTNKTFNYGPIHEMRKSILKAAIVFAWQDIMREILQTYASWV